MVLLEVRDLTKYFGGLAAVSGLNFTVDSGEILGLIGPNGAGKTTTFNLISGFLRPTAGRVVLKGKDITGLSPAKIVQQGLARTFQLTSLVDPATALDNVLLSFYPRSRGGVWSRLFTGFSHADVKDAMRILELTGLEGREGEIAHSLAHGHQRTLSIAIALATQPELLLLDEPVSGMNREEAAMVMETVSKLSKQGVTSIMVEHDMHTVLNFCTRIVVLDFGKKIAEGTSQEIQQNEKVIEAYLGAEVA